MSCFRESNSARSTTALPRSAWRQSWRSDPEKREQVLAVVPDNVVEGLPELKKERGTRPQEALGRAAAMSSAVCGRPCRICSIPARGTDRAKGSAAGAARRAFRLAGSGKARPGGGRPSSPGLLPVIPEIRREGMMRQRQGPQVVSGDLKEAKFSGRSIRTGNWKRCSSISGSTISTCMRARAQRDRCHRARAMSAMPSARTCWGSSRICCWPGCPASRHALLPGQLGIDVDRRVSGRAVAPGP